MNAPAMGWQRDDVTGVPPTARRGALAVALSAALLFIVAASCGSVGRKDSDGASSQGGQQGGDGQGGATATDAASGSGGAGGGATTGAGGSSVITGLRARGGIAVLGANPAPTTSAVRISNQSISVTGLPTCVGAICVSGGIRP